MNLQAFFRNKVLIIIIVFTAFACAGFVYASIKNLQWDKEQLQLIEFTNNIEKNISHSRIVLDDFFLYKDTLKKEEILNCYKHAHKNIITLDSFIVRKFSGNQAVDLRESLTIVAGQVSQLHKQISTCLNSDKATINIVLSDSYHNFQYAYQGLNKSINNYIFQENIRFKKEIFKFGLAIFCLLVICVILIYRMINLYNAVEKKQATKYIEVEFKERKRIAADLHDGLGSVLSSIALFVKLIEKDSKDNAVNKNLKKINELSGIALENLEAAINNLNPSNLNRYGLIKSLEIICENINDTGRLSCVVNAENMESKLEQNLEINIYRICKELINNTLKHSRASKLLIHIKKIKKTVLLTYRDNGKGFNPDLIFSDDDEKMGLRNIVNRVESFGGKYEINSKERNGVEILLRFNI